MTMKHSSASKVSLRRFRPGIALISDGYTNGIIGAIITILMRNYPESKFGMQYNGRLLGAAAFYMVVCGFCSNRQQKMVDGACYMVIFSAAAGIWSVYVMVDMAWLVHNEIPSPR
ncbi:hypothetical protein EDD15DRAFT_1180759 [Pisolithus albus]|nr:hypothetical protein EDD15DRAFT_1180759 [Pisolithus albus]